VELGNGFSRPNLFRMVRFAEVFPEQQIVSTLSRQLGWSHFVEVIPLGGSLGGGDVSRETPWPENGARDVTSPPAAVPNIVGRTIT
jgi:hypothetical protein